MKFLQGQSRDQINLFPVSLDRSIDPENEVRIIDLFVESLKVIKQQTAKIPTNKINAPELKQVFRKTPFRRHA